MRSKNWFVVLCVLAPAGAFAADFDGSKPLICAPVEAHECVSTLTCERGTPKELGTPTFLRIDVAKKTIAGTERTSPIKAIENNGEQILMSGTELDSAWTFALDQRDGDFSLSLVDKDGVFAVFGTCTVL